MEEFSRANPQRLYVIVNLEVNALEYPDNGDDQVKNNLVEWAAGFGIGQNVNRDGEDGIRDPAEDVVGITRIDVLFGLTDPPATDVTIDILGNEVMTLDIADITVNNNL